MPRIGIEEEADGDARIFESTDDIGGLLPLAGDVQSALGGDLFAPLRHEGRLVRLHLAGDRQHLRFAGHFQVELDGNGLAEDPQIALLDVAAVLAEMDGDAVGPAQFGQCGRPDRVGLESPPRLADRRHVVDVDAKFCHGL